jgi:uncharacterized protein (DUF58 family)
MPLATSMPRPMLTSRGFWFLLTVVVLLGAAIALQATLAILVCHTLLLWFLAHWFLFQWRFRAVQSHLGVARSLWTSRGPVESIWARQRSEVRVVLTCRPGVALPFVVVTDRVPAPAHWLGGLTQAEGALSADAPLELAYAIQCPGPGRIRFDGVRVQLADLAGLFYQILFVRDVREFRVLPGLPLDPAHATFVKTQNTLPLLGTHRHPRPGSGSELFDLRDYLSGDPPKMIAWKISARRDRLITRELESEVPIRCMLFVDASNSVRVGPAGRTALCRLVEIAAGVTEANTVQRDLTGLCLFDEAGVRRLIRAGRGRPHLYQLLDELTEAAALLPEVEQSNLIELLPYAYGLAQDVYPDLLRPDVNHMPWWLPFWAPQPRYTLPRPPAAPRRGWRRRLIAPFAGAARWLRYHFWPRFPLWTRPLRPAHHRAYRWRKQLAAIMAVRYDLGPGGLALLLEDDTACGQYLQRFLAEHQVTHPYPLYDGTGRYLFRAPEKFRVVADALMAAVARGKDNELFVLLADLFEGGPELARLERAVCVARARHHQVLVICPWPAAVPLPPRPAATLDPAERPRGHSLPEPTWQLDDIVLRAATLRLHQAYSAVRQTFARLNVPVLCAADDDTVDIVLYRMQRLRVRERGVR